MKQYYVYILACKINGTLYIGVTNDLKNRIYEYKNKLIKGFTEKYTVDKLDLIAKSNPILNDL